MILKNNVNMIIANNKYYPYEKGIGKFSSSGKFNISGNIMSLIYGDDFYNKKLNLSLQK